MQKYYTWQNKLQLLVQKHTMRAGYTKQSIK